MAFLRLPDCLKVSAFGHFLRTAFTLRSIIRLRSQNFAGLLAKTNRESI